MVGVQAGKFPRDDNLVAVVLAELSEIFRVEAVDEVVVEKRLVWQFADSVFCFAAWRTGDFFLVATTTSKDSNNRNIMLL